MKFIFNIFLLIFLIGCSTKEKAKESVETEKEESKVISKSKLEGIWRLDSIAGTDECLSDFLYFIPGDSLVRLHIVNDSMMMSNYNWDTSRITLVNENYPINYIDSNKIVIAFNNMNHYFIKREEFRREELNSKLKSISMYNYLFGKWDLDSADAYPIGLTLNCSEIMPNSILEFTTFQEIKVTKSVKTSRNCWEPWYNLSYDFESKKYNMNISAGCTGGYGTITKFNEDEIYIEGMTERAEIIKLKRIKE